MIPGRRVEASWYRRYLRMLGLEDLEGALPSLESLNRIVRSHRHMPFESISSLQRRYRAGLVGPVASLNLDEQLDAWERRAGGARDIAARWAAPLDREFQR